VLRADLLRRHVADRPEYDALHRATSARHADVRLQAARRSVHQFRKAEVQNLHASISRNEQVLGLQVAMDDPFIMCGGKPSRRLCRVGESL
jgi:hypothetical protein